MGTIKNKTNKQQMQSAIRTCLAVAMLSASVEALEIEKRGGGRGGGRGKPGEKVVSHAIISMTTSQKWESTIIRVTVSHKISLMHSQLPWIAQILGLSKLEELPPKQQRKLSAWPGANSRSTPTIVRHIVLQVKVTMTMNEVRHEIRSRRDKTVLL